MSYKPYPNYRQSKSISYGNSPIHWAQKRFKYAIFLSRGMDLSAENFLEGQYPVCASNGIIGYHNQCTAKGPSITVGRSGSVGEVNYIESDFWAHNTALFGQSFYDTTPRFAYYLLLTLETKNLSAGSAVGTLNRNNIHDLPIELPPLPEQRAIAAFLDRETERIDSLIEKKRKQIELLQKKRVALISQAVTKGLDPKVKMRESGVEWLGKVPEGWKISKIGWKSRVVRGASPRPAGDPLYFFGDFIPWITVGEITKDEEKYLTGTETMLTRLGMEFSRVMQCNTLVLTNSGATLGVPKIFKISGCANDGVVALLDISNDMIQGYIYFYLVLMTKVYRDRIKQGSGQPNLNTEIIQSTAIPVPPKEEQNAIIAFLDIEINRIDSIKEKIVRSIDKLEQYRTSLISSAVTGKIDVRNEVEIPA